MAICEHPVVAIVGPTASGKSELAQRVAKVLSTEIISCDSMQIYRGMDIGTAKLLESQRIVRHHGIDIVDPGTPFSAALFQEFARDIIDGLHCCGKIPVLCGGTGFYVRAALDDYQFPKGEQDGNPVRDLYNAYAKENGATALWELLNEVDPDSAADIHPNNVKRVVRAFELLAEGESYHAQKKHLSLIQEYYRSIMIGLEWDREVLYKRIDNRVDAMVEEGLVDEVKRLLDQGFSEAITAPQAIGYKEIVSALNGTITLEEALAQIKQATRRYAKRQLSWFRQDKRVIWIDAEQPLDHLEHEALSIIRTQLDQL